MSLVLRNKRNLPRPWAGELERFFDDWVPAPQSKGEWAPAVDVKETEEAYILTADVPGIKKEDIDISVKENMITLKGERKREEEKKEGMYSRYERSYGMFQRSFTVHDGFDAEKVEAHYSDGVLTVTLPKIKASKPRQIDVKVR